MTDPCCPNGRPRFANPLISDGSSFIHLSYYLRDEFEKDDHCCVVGLSPFPPISWVGRIAVVPPYKAVLAQNESVLFELMTEVFDGVFFRLSANGAASHE